MKTFVLGLSAVAVLLTYLYVSVGLRHRDAWRRHREDLARGREFRAQWQATVLDISSISPKLDHLRRDYLAAVHSQSRYARYHTRLIGSVRKALLRLPYFRSVDPAWQSRNQDKRTLTAEHAKHAENGMSRVR